MQPSLPTATPAASVSGVATGLLDAPNRPSRILVEPLPPPVVASYEGGNGTAGGNDGRNGTGGRGVLGLVERPKDDDDGVKEEDAMLMFIKPRETVVMQSVGAVALAGARCWLAGAAAWHPRAVARP